MYLVEVFIKIINIKFLEIKKIKIYMKINYYNKNNIKLKELLKK